MARKRGRGRRKCLLCHQEGFFREIEGNMYTGEYLCRECARLWRRRELIVYKSKNDDRKVSFVPFEGGLPHEVVDFKKCEHRYKFPLLKLKENPSSAFQFHRNGVVQFEENVIDGSGNQSRKGNNVEAGSNESVNLILEGPERALPTTKSLNITAPSFNTPRSASFRSEKDIHSSVVPQKSISFDLSDLNLAFITGNRLLESVEHITNVVGQALSRVQHAEDELALRIRNERTTILRQQREIRGELSELKLLLQRFKFRNGRKA